MSRAEANGVCPHCQAYTGPVGTPCIRAACAEGPYHCIPVDWYDATRAYSARKSRPIDPRVGRMVDKYLLCANLGEGGMGSVYVAIQKPLFREVALKLIADVELTKHAVGRFEREARAISLLDHPNIVKIHDYGVTQLERKMPFMVLEYLRHARTLRKAIGSLRTGESVDAAVVLRIFQQVLNALGAAHAVGIIHRDVKPENIMVLAVHGDPCFVKVLDFGLARLESDETNFEGEDVAAGRLVGTPYYMAPEQIPTRKNASVTLDGRADLYAVAVMLYEILTGTRPFEASDPLGVLARKMDPELDPLALPAAQSLTKAQRNLLARGLARDPEQRFGTASEMAQALEQALNPSSRVVGLVVLGSDDSSDRVVAPGSDPGTVPSPNPETATPATRTPAPGDPGISGPAVPDGRISRSVPRPLEPPREATTFPSPSPGLEIDLPEISTAPWARPGPLAAPPTPTPGPAAPTFPGPPAPSPTPPRPRSEPPRPSPRTSCVLRNWILGIGTLAAVLVLVPVGISWWRMDRVQEELAVLSQQLSRQGHFVGVGSPRLRADSGGYVVLPEGASGAADPVRDPWGTPYRVHLDVRRGVYMIRSLGPDRDAGVCREQEEGGDDFCRDLGPP
ncbi:protein kinase [Myxococcota bacterium]|nr:protein kinase [Myxococcota bacterium]